MLPETPKMFVDDFCQIAKQGDLIFLCEDCAKVPYVIQDCISHVGIVLQYCCELFYFDISLIFRCYYGRTSHLKEVNFCPLKTKLCNFRGVAFVKRLCHNVSQIDPMPFVQFAQNNLEYDHNLFLTALLKVFGKKNNSRFKNCGELIIDMLIYLQILKKTVVSNSIVNPLKYLQNIPKHDYVATNCSYENFIELMLKFY